MFGGINISKPSSTLRSSTHANVLHTWRKKIKVLRTVSHNKAKIKQTKRHQKLTLKTKNIMKNINQLKSTLKISMEHACRMIRLCKKKNQ